MRDGRLVLAAVAGRGHLRAGRADVADPGSADRARGERCGTRPSLMARIHFLPHELIAHERQPLTVRRPRRDVDRALTAEELRQYVDLAAARGHDAERDVLVLRVPGDVLLVRQEDQPLS